MGNQTGSQKAEAPGRAYQPSGISITRTQIPLSGRAMEAIKELKRQDMNSYRYLLICNNNLDCCSVCCHISSGIDNWG